MKTITECAAEVQVLNHDFWDRPHDHTFLKDAETRGRAGTLGLFSVNKGFGMKSLRDDYAWYTCAPR